MTRYEACRKIGLDPIAAAITTFVHYLQGAPEGYIAILHMIIEYDVNGDSNAEYFLSKE
jgi:hypothetical protein